MKNKAFLAILSLCLACTAHAGRSSGGSVIHCEDANRAVSMQIVPAFPEGSMVSVDGDAVSIVNASRAPDGELTYEISDGSVVSMYPTYNGQSFPAHLSKSGSTRSLTCQGIVFSGNGW